MARGNRTGIVGWGLLGVLGAVGAGLAAWLRPRAASAEPPGPVYVFEPEVITHSPEFLARQAAAAAATASPPPPAQSKIVAAAPAAAPTQGGPTMTTRQKRITELLQLVKTEGDATKKAALQEELKKLALEEKAALEAKPSEPLPTYPPGLIASFGGKQVTVLQAWRTPDGSWAYAVNAKLGMMFGLGDGKHTQTEAEIRGRLSEALGAMAPGQAYPKGITIYRNGQGGTVDQVAAGGAGGFTYAIRGWPNWVSQDELQAILRRA